ncbi:unnamed protein product [Bemisia tabaci]|uniref:Uncharacterized protein n=1 Tax=Bemisia tabaci TaxID=7038 RepID=A0A9P0AIS1_BEMTA|nr:unnamed protein product [Bemisia tabaci]
MNNGWVDMERWRKIKESVSYYFNVCMCCKKPSETRDPQSNASASSNERDFHARELTSTPLLSHLSFPFSRNSPISQSYVRPAGEVSLIFRRSIFNFIDNRLEGKERFSISLCHTIKVLHQNVKVKCCDWFKSSNKPITTPDLDILMAGFDSVTQATAIDEKIRAWS